MTEAARTRSVRQVDADVAAIAGSRFPRHAVRSAPTRLSDALGFGVDGGVWVKDETGQVAGSHKARHLVTILLHLLTAESTRAGAVARATDRPPLAIASCGNAAFAAATLAAAVQWPLRGVRAADGRSGGAARCSVSCGADVIECARAGSPIRPATRASTASAKPSRPGPSRSPCRARRTHGASTVAARSVGRWPVVRRGGRRSAARPAVHPGGCGNVRGVHDRRIPDEWRHAASCTPCRPTAARHWPGRGCDATIRRAIGAPRHIGASACGRGNTSATPRPTASSTTRRTTGYPSFERWARATARRSSCRRRE